MKIPAHYILLVLLVGGLFTIPGIQASQAINDAPSMADLKNATYSGIEDGAITLLDGSWQGEPWVEGGAARPGVGLVEDFYLAGDLDGDGRQEAVAVLWQNSGGTGSYTFIAVMNRTDDGIRNLDTALIGDRVKLRNWKIADGRIMLDVLQAGASDAMCCPGTLATRIWAMEDGRLEEGQIKMTGRLSLAALEGTGWLLTHLDRQTRLENADVTLNFEAGRISGKSACNRYSAHISDGENAGDIDIGQAMSTRMACPEELMKVEQEYLDALARVSRFSFNMGELTLSGQKKDGGAFSLLFQQVEAEQP